MLQQQRENDDGDGDGDAAACAAIMNKGNLVLPRCCMIGMDGGVLARSGSDCNCHS